MTRPQDPSPYKQPPRVASLKTVEAFKAHLGGLAIPIACDDTLLPPGENPLAAPAEIGGLRVGNRFTVQPMEGWDGTPGGKPSELTVRRWKHFGQSGAKLIWGGEAVAIRHEGRANPRQLTLSDGNRAELAALLTVLKAEHLERHGGTDDLVTGLQLTHSGRYCRPGPGHDLAPRIAYRHPVLDRQFGLADDKTAQAALMSDGELGDLVGDFVAGAVFIQEAGFDFFYSQHRHGYLLPDERRVFLGFVGLEAAGVDDGIGSRLPLGVTVEAVAGGTRDVLDDRLAIADQAVEQRGLTDVRPSNYRRHRLACIRRGRCILRLGVRHSTEAPERSRSPGASRRRW